MSDDAALVGGGGLVMVRPPTGNQMYGLNPYQSVTTKGDTKAFLMNRTGSNMELHRQVAAVQPEPPKVFSDKVKEETEKIKKQMGVPGNH